MLYPRVERRCTVEALTIIGYAVLAAAVLGIVINLKDIVRYVHITRM
jgi:hypothetical protein